MSEVAEKRHFGWLPDYPDYRDFSYEHDKVPEKMIKLGQKDSINAMFKKIVKGSAAGLNLRDEAETLPLSIDLRSWCSPIEDQKQLGSCTAHACVGLVEYFERRAFNKHIDAARLFIYKTTRNLMHMTGDTGAFLRSTMGALVLFGVPPEEYWPYVIADFDKEPSAFCYAFAQNYQAINYYRLDPPGTAPSELLNRIKKYLILGLPSMFGFTVYSSISQANSSGKIPYPVSGEKIEGGHAIAAVGFDDNMKIKNSGRGAQETKGALLIRNSWGTTWGDAGYGWLPYEYVLKGLATDWWSLLKNEWVNTGNFGV